jgi:hypothetical protein
LEDVVQDAEVHRCIVTIVNFVAVCAEDLKVGLMFSVIGTFIYVYMYSDE